MPPRTRVERITASERPDETYAPLQVTLGNKYDVQVIPIPRIRLHLHDIDLKRMPNARFRILIADEVFIDSTADANGSATVKLPRQCPTSLVLRWGSDPADPLKHRVVLFPACATGNPRQDAIARLSNLGYPAAVNLALAARQFQAEFEVDNTPEPIGLQGDELPPASRERLNRIFATFGFEQNFTTNEQPNPDATGPGKPVPVVSKPSLVFAPDLFTYVLVAGNWVPVLVLCFEILIAAGEKDPRKFYNEFQATQVKFLGRTLDKDEWLHVMMIDKLASVENALRLRNPGLTDVELGSLMGLRKAPLQGIDGSRERPTSATVSMHFFGCAIDVDSVTQFYLEKPTAPLRPDEIDETVMAQVNEILEHARWLESGSLPPPRIWSSNPPSVAISLSRGIGAYFSLPDLPVELTAATNRLLSRLVPDSTNPAWDQIKNDPSTAQAEVKKKILEQRDKLIRTAKKEQQSRAGEIIAALQEVGVFGIKEELIAECARQGVGWAGGDDDLMHFDLRTDGGRGQAIQEAIQQFKGRNAPRIPPGKTAKEFGQELDSRIASLEQEASALKRQQQELESKLEENKSALDKLEKNPEDLDPSERRTKRQELRQERNELIAAKREAAQKLTKAERDLTKANTDRDALRGIARLSELADDWHNELPSGGLRDRRRTQANGEMQTLMMGRFDQLYPDAEKR